MADCIEQCHSAEFVDCGCGCCQDDVDACDHHDGCADPWGDLTGVGFESRDFRIVQLHAFADFEQRENQQHEEDDADSS